MMTSGAIQYGEPAKVWRLAMEWVSCTDSPKSARLSFFRCLPSPRNGNQMLPWGLRGNMWRGDGGAFISSLRPSVLRLTVGHSPVPIETALNIPLLQLVLYFYLFHQETRPLLSRQATSHQLFIRVCLRFSIGRRQQHTSSYMPGSSETSMRRGRLLPCSKPLVREEEWHQCHTPPYPWETLTRRNRQTPTLQTSNEYQLLFRLSKYSPV